MPRFKWPLRCPVVCWGIDNEIRCDLELLGRVFCAGSLGTAICRSQDAVMVSTLARNRERNSKQCYGVGFQGIVRNADMLLHMKGRIVSHGSF